jgi:ribonuclease BN (tRNA processing enzyme)
MEVRVLGCYGNAVGRYRTTAFLINDSILLDAGAVTDVLADEEIKKISHVILSHTHIDHVKGLFALVDELTMLGQYSVELVSAWDILDLISEHLFNDRIWPDFTVIPSESQAVLRLHPLQAEQTENLDGLSVTPIVVDHTVLTVGFILKEGSSGFMYTADTGPTERFWEIASKEEGIEFIIADVSFPNRLEKLARISGHMTLSMLMEQIEKYGLQHKVFYLTHMKPIFIGEILEEVRSLKRPNLHVLKQGGVLRL